MAGGTIRHETAAERKTAPPYNGGPPQALAASRLDGRARMRGGGPREPYEPSLSQVLLVTALAAAASAIVLAVARSAAGDAVVAPIVTACVRTISYAGLVMAAGTVAFATVVWPRGRSDRRLELTVWFGWLAIGAATVLQLAMHEGAGLLVPGGDRVANALALRLGLLLVSIAWVAAALRGRPVSRLVGLGLFVALASTWVYAGPEPPGAVTVVVTVIHLAAACLWLGGLLVLAVVILPAGRTLALTRVLARFSRLATGCVAVLAATGTLHAVSRAGSAGNLFATPYGYAFWLKVTAVAAMLVVANGNRRYVVRHVVRVASGPEEPVAVGATRHNGNGGGVERRVAPPLQMLGLFLGAEVAFGVLVMVLTAVLVGASVSR